MRILKKKSIEVRLNRSLGEPQRIEFKTLISKSKKFTYNINELFTTFTNMQKLYSL